MLGEGYRTVDGRWELRCAGGPGHVHEIVLGTRLGYRGKTLAEHALNALPHCISGAGWEPPVGERPDEAQWESWLKTAEAVIVRAVAEDGSNDGWVRVSDDEWTALVAVIGDAADYMVTNGYGNDEDFPDDAAAARVFTGHDGAASLAGLEACRSVWVGGPAVQ